MIVYVTDGRSVAFLALRVNEIIRTSQGTSGRPRTGGKKAERKGRKEREPWGGRKGQVGRAERQVWCEGGTSVVVTRAPCASSCSRAVQC